MAYTLYLDRPETFECEIQVKNASLKNSMARLVVESRDGINFIFNGKIEGEKCIVPIRRLKGLLDENSNGNMHLEVIVEDTYFQPWKSDFTVEEHTSVKVKMNESKSMTNKPIVNVKVFKPHSKASVALQEILTVCKKFNINKSTIKNRKQDFIQIVKEYFKLTPEVKSQKPIILEGLKLFLK